MIDNEEEDDGDLDDVSGVVDDYDGGGDVVDNEEEMAV